MDQTLKFKSQRGKPIKLPQENSTASKINSMVYDFYVYIWFLWVSPARCSSNLNTPWFLHHYGYQNQKKYKTKENYYHIKMFFKHFHVNFYCPLKRNTRAIFFFFSQKSLERNNRDSLVAQLVKNPPGMQGTLVQVLGQEDPPEESMAIHSSSCLENPWTEKPGRLQSTWSQRIGYD